MPLKSLYSSCPGPACDSDGVAELCSPILRALQRMMVAIDSNRPLNFLFCLNDVDLHPYSTGIG